MAEKRSKRVTDGPNASPERKLGGDSTSKAVEEMSPSIPDCPVCLQPSIHPVKVPCGHVFCFLCVKGASHQNQCCALCRQAIPPTFFDNPTLLAEAAGATPSSSIPEKERYAWFYEGRNGWWQYDERTNIEIEDGYRDKKRSFELLIAGYMYIIDLDNMTQMRRSDPSRRRRIKRDLMTAPKKGTAGLKLAQDAGEEAEGATGVPGNVNSKQEQSQESVENSSDNTNTNAVQYFESSHDLSEGLESLSLASGQNEVVEPPGADQGVTNEDDKTI